jgi:hypothetical protein
MILSFACRDTQKLFEGACVRLWVNIESTVIRKLAMLNRALKVLGKVVKTWCGEDL